MHKQILSCDKKGFPVAGLNINQCGMFSVHRKPRNLAPTKSRFKINILWYSPVFLCTCISSPRPVTQSVSHLVSQSISQSVTKMEFFSNLTIMIVAISQASLRYISTKSQPYLSHISALSMPYLSHF